MNLLFYSHFKLIIKKVAFITGAARMEPLSICAAISHGRKLRMNYFQVLALK